MPQTAAVSWNKRENAVSAPTVMTTIGATQDRTQPSMSHWEWDRTTTHPHDGIKKGSKLLPRTLWPQEYQKEKEK